MTDNIENKIHSLTRELDALERMFNLYFTAQEKRPPLRQLSSLRQKVTALMGIAEKINKSSIKYTVSSFVQRFTTYRLKWEKGVKDIEEGRLKPGLHFFGGMHPMANMHSKHAPVEEPVEKPVEKVAAKPVKKPTNIETQLDKATKNFVKLSKEHLGKDYNVDVVKSTLNAKLKIIKGKYGDNFSLKVQFKDGKVKITPVKKEK